MHKTTSVGDGGLKAAYPESRTLAEFRGRHTYFAGALSMLSHDVIQLCQSPDRGSFCVSRSPWFRIHDLIVVPRRDGCKGEFLKP